jgi:hypothetical protein
VFGQTLFTGQVTKETYCIVLKKNFDANSGLTAVFLTLVGVTKELQIVFGSS